MRDLEKICILLPRRPSIHLRPVSVQGKDAMKLAIAEPTSPSCPRAAVNLGRCSPYRSNTSFKKKQTSTGDFCPPASSVSLTLVVVPSLVKVTCNFVPSVGVCLVNVLIVYSHKVALQIKGKTSLVDRRGMREVGDLKKTVQPP